MAGFLRAWKKENGRWYIGCHKLRMFHEIPQECVEEIRNSPESGE